MRNWSKDTTRSISGWSVACRRDFSLTQNRIQTHRRSALRPGSILTASLLVAGGFIGSQIVGGITLRRSPGSSCSCHAQVSERTTRCPALSRRSLAGVCADGGRFKPPSRRLLVFLLPPTGCSPSESQSYSLGKVSPARSPVRPPRPQSI